MSSSDIDRVLANIRKLVSVEEDAQSGSGRLILTADLRVDEPAPDEPAPDEPAPTDLPEVSPAADQQQPSGSLSERNAPPRSLEDRIADLQSTRGPERPVEEKPDASDEPARPVAERVSQVRPVRPERRGAPMVLRPLADEAEQTPSPIDEPGAADADQDSGRPYDDPEARSEPSELQFFHAGPSEGFDRAVFTGRDDPLEPGEDEQFLDEDALRDLVAEIVREELAGALGERITRNVRKLVRREIMRTLSTRDFD
ncbi:hypothetical protein [Palleronia marisminoris]|nr:hypothetical protein [Palleronia marisminoris]